MASDDEPPQKRRALGTLEHVDIRDAMPQYYARFFPFDRIARWLAYDDPVSFRRREFAFNVPGEKFRRYRSFESANEFRAAVLRDKPEKIDIGAVYNMCPKDKERMPAEPVFAPVARELVFDIDLSDYDDVRTCCKGTDVCRQCWILATVAIRVLDAALREDFGYVHLLWVYSGRRGIHCWVCDERARKLVDAGRSTIVGFLTVVDGGGCGQARRVRLTSPLHPSLERALGIMRTAAQTLATPAQAQPVQVTQQTARGRQVAHDAESIFRRWYPRLDANVTRQTGHLLKAPFCVHPGTGRVCVLIDPAHCELFDPEAAPTVASLFEELNASYATSVKDGGAGTSMSAPCKANFSSKTACDYKKTSLRESIELFDQFLARLETAKCTGAVSA